MSESDSDSADQSPRRRKKIRYQQKYSQSWEQKFKWISSSEKGNKLFFCKICKADYIGGLTEIVRHEQGKKHQTNARVIKNQNTLTNFIISVTSEYDQKVKALKSAELRIAAFIVEHNIPLSTANHLPQLISAICPDSQIAQEIKCAATKSSGIIKHVLGEYNFLQLIDQLKNKNFSLLVDESTDRGPVKHLALVVRMLEKEIVSDNFLTLIPITEASASHLYGEIKKFFSDHKIPMSNIIGFAADGANVMMGQNQSVAKFIKDDVPHIFIMKCSCHSFALCASYACKKLPESVETLVREIYKFFKYSTKKTAQLKEFQEFCEIKPHKMLQPSNTRWLSLIAVVKRVLEQWNALKLFFHGEIVEEPRNELANLIHEKLQNVFCKMYLYFLDFILPFIVDLNKEMQSEKPKIYKLYATIERTYKLILELFIKRHVLDSREFYKIDVYDPHNLKDIEELDLGGNVTVYISQHNDIPISELKKFRLTCLAFYQELCIQISNRFRFENNPLKYLNYLVPANIKEKKNPSLALLVSHFCAIAENEFNDLDREWKKLSNTPEYELDFSKNFEDFWNDVATLTDNSDNLIFPLLVKFINYIRILPHSTATVERIFSAINLNKTLIRNSLSTATLCGVLHTKKFFKSGKKCYNLEFGDDLLKKIKNWKNCNHKENETATSSDIDE